MRSFGAQEAFTHVVKSSLQLSIVFTLAMIFTNRTSGAVVYENSSEPVGVLTFSLKPIGDEITLAGTEREVVELQIGVSMQGEAGTCDFQAWIHANDGPDGEPETMLWGSEIMEAVPLTGAVEFIVFDVPNVTVPDTFTWTLQKSNPAPITVGLPWYRPPSVGSSAAHGWLRIDTFWQKTLPGQFGDVNYMARVIAVPEPASILLLSLGGIALRRKRRTVYNI